MNLYEIPPNNCLFSRRWLHRDEVNSEGYQKVIQDNIDSTNKKLEDLETELQHKLRGISLDDTILVNATRRVGLKKWIRTIHYLKSSIGVWQDQESIRPRMLYPDKTVNMNSWDSDILGPIFSTSYGNLPSDVCVVMLSDVAVKWLNDIRDVDPSFYSTARI